MQIKPHIKLIPKGLLGGADITWVDRVSKFGNRCSRPRYPNIQKCWFYSELLDKQLAFHVTTSVMRSIDKKGGLDAYLLRTCDKKLGSDVAISWKSILQYAASKKYPITAQ
jgi:large subunit ribosomal protein L28